jgi:hypothetical protein
MGQIEALERAGATQESPIAGIFITGEDRRQRKAV